MARPTIRSRALLALIAALLLGSGTGWTQTQTSPQRADERLGDSLLAALVRLSPSQRRDYLQAARRLEESRSRTRLAELNQLERCLAETGDAAVRSCWRTLREQRQRMHRLQRQEELSLAQRFGLPQPRRAAMLKPVEW